MACKVVAVEGNNAAGGGDQCRTGKEVQGGRGVDVNRVVALNFVERVTQFVDFGSRFQLDLKLIQLGVGGNHVEVFKRCSSGKFFNAFFGAGCEASF